MLKLTTTKRKLLGALETGTLTIEVSGRAPLEFKVSAIEREDGSGRSFNVKLTDGSSIYMRTSD